MIKQCCGNFTSLHKLILGKTKSYALFCSQPCYIKISAICFFVHTQKLQNINVVLLNFNQYPV